MPIAGDRLRPWRVVAAAGPISANVTTAPPSASTVRRGAAIAADRTNVDTGAGPRRASAAMRGRSDASATVTATSPRPHPNPTSFGISQPDLIDPGFYCRRRP